MLRFPLPGCSMLLVGAVAAALLGCEGEPTRPTSAPPASVLEIVLKTPEDAARSVLTCLQADLRAVARRDEQTSKACLEKLRSVAAVTTIEQTLARVPQFKAVLGDDPIEGYVDNWGAAIAYYAGVTAKDGAGFHFEQIRRASEAPSKVAVVVPASGLEDDALIQVTCVLEDDNLWRVSRIELVAETPPAKPAAQPASQPS